MKRRNRKVKKKVVSFVTLECSPRWTPGITCEGDSYFRRSRDAKMSQRWLLQKN